MKDLTTVHEFWYGDGYVEGGETWLDVKIAPAAYLYADEELRLCVDTIVPVLGPMIMHTVRTVRCQPGQLTPRTPPERVISISYDPAPGDGAWQGRVDGDFVCCLVKVERFSRFDRGYVV